MSTVEVYKETFLALYAQTGRLDLLKHCQLDHDSHGMPSWIPNWAVRKAAQRIPQSFSASGWSKAYASSKPNGVLAVLGTRAGVVRRFEPLRSRSRMAEDWVVLIRRMAKEQASPTSSNIRRQNIDDICATLCCNAFSDNFQPQILSYPDFETSKQFLNRLIESDADADPSFRLTADVQRYINLVALCSNHRSFIVTEDDQIGIAPEETAPGDEIAVILGCDLPMVLRPTAQGFLVVGECYLHGYMQAEPLLGPLPHPWQRVNRYSEELEGSFECFFDKETDQYQLDNPRLSPLPNGWRVKSHAEEAWWNRYVNENTGEDAGEFDPRLTPESLKQRGVNLQEFRLI